jgi:macrolide transport system ATP-binding/permease protein
MREILKLRNIAYEVESNIIFEKINGSVLEGEIIGIIGKNGAGKSTLLNIIGQTITPTAGKLEWIEENLKVVMVEQEVEDFLSNLKNPRELQLLSKWKVPNQTFSKLSGGEKLKARLAKGLSHEADILLLDEPTNHLDEQSMDVFINEVKNYNGTIILVSHDRYFLDEVATKIWAIENKHLIEHKGNYTSYMEERKQKRLAQERAYEKQQKMIERIEGQIKELSSWSKKAHAQSTKKDGFKEFYRKKAKRMDTQIKSKQKRLEKELEKAKIERVQPEYEVQFSLQTNKRVGKRFLEVKDLSKAFGDKMLFKNVSFTIQHGEKVALMGPNGSGKTTLLNMILGKESGDGSIWISPSSNIGYLTQEVFDLPLDQSPEMLFYQETFEARGKVQNLLKHLGFSANQWEEPIGNMSMGERVKCKLMKYILEEKDVLILDEPTNHLDLPSREQLEDALAEYPGTLFVVSHDRYFLEKTTNVKLIIEKEQVRKELSDAPIEKDDKEELRLKLETERQEVLGKLSFLTPNDAEYQQLDKRFMELTKQINEL